MIFRIPQRVGLFTGLLAAEDFLVARAGPVQQKTYFFLKCKTGHDATFGGGAQMLQQLKHEFENFMKLEQVGEQQI